MPNWVANKIILSGKNVDKVFAHVIKKNKELGEKEFDFNTLIKQPEELNIVSGSGTHRAVELYLAKINPDIDFYGKSEDKISKEEYQSIVDKMTNPFVKTSLNEEQMKYIFENMKYYANDEKSFLELGETAINNLLKYGAMDWYDWRVEHWGSKWNADSTYVNREKNEITFYTAWSQVDPVIAKLAEMFPDTKIEYEFAEEIPGSFAGRNLYENGKLIESEYLSDNKEAFEIYFKLWGGSENFRFNESTGNYEYIDSMEEMC